MAGNVMSWGKALLEGLEPGSYSYDADKIPVGEYEVILDFKIWARNTMGIGCYFTVETSKDKIQLTVYCHRETGLFKIRDSEIDFVHCPTGHLYAIEVGMNVVNERRRMVLKKAKLTRIASI